MIKQAAIGLNSRDEAVIYNEDGFLPLITAPMYSVVDENNYQVFLDNKVQVCLPRNISLGDKYPNTTKGFFISMSLKEFKLHIEYPTDLVEQFAVCIDTANGNIPALHDAIRKAKEIHGDSLIIMAGNVASVEAFVELAKTGVDYIRVGIGGGSGCNTTGNVGVGEENLEELIKECYTTKKYFSPLDCGAALVDLSRANEILSLSPEQDQIVNNVRKVKIVADSISSYIKLCQDKYGFNDNGYAAINKLLFAGADLVMIGALFAQCVESAGEKSIDTITGSKRIKVDIKEIIEHRNQWGSFERCFVKYAGMSTHEEQKKYKQQPIEEFRYAVYKGNGVLAAYYKTKEEAVESCKKDSGYSWKDLLNVKPSEGSVKFIPVRWTLPEWLEGSDNQDEYPYLMGWPNSYKSAKAYAGRK